MDLVETLLPGVGIRYELATAQGVRLGVVVRREGSVEINTYDVSDPDSAQSVFHLTAEEANTLADVLGAPRLAERFADLSREVPGLKSGRFSLRAGTPYVDRPLGDTQARTRTGCSIVAVVRDNDVVTSPAPSEVLRADDVLVVIGSEQGLSELGARLAGQA